MEELKPCPFCGGNAHLDFAHGSNQSYLSNNGFAKSTPLLYMVLCDECYTRTIACENSSVAMQIWNRRAE